MTNKQYLL